MKAIILETPGGVENLTIQEVERPTIKSGEVLIQVKAISINPVDVKSRSGKGVYGRIKDENPLILGWDISGIVVESQDAKFKTGDAVFGMVQFPGHGRAYAEYVAAPASQLALKPQNITHEEAAAATLVALTAWQALVKNAQVQKGQKVLIHAASGGVGHIAVQIAKYLGATVVGTSSAKNRDFVLGLGADAHIDYHTYDWTAHPREFDFVLDTIGGNNIDHSLEVTKEGGRGLNDHRPTLSLHWDLILFPAEDEQIRHWPLEKHDEEVSLLYNFHSRQPRALSQSSCVSNHDRADDVHL